MISSTKFLSKTILKVKKVFVCFKKKAIEILLFNRFIGCKIKCYSRCWGNEPEIIPIAGGEWGILDIE